MRASQGNERWRNVSPVPLARVRELAASRGALDEFLTEAFESTFSRSVDEVIFDSFPDGLGATMYVTGRDSRSHNVWAVKMASELSAAGVEVSVVVRPTSDRLEAVSE